MSVLISVPYFNVLFQPFYQCLVSVILIFFLGFQSEAIPESLKNMLLVMHTGGVLGQNTDVEQSQLSKMTWERVSLFMPALKNYIFQPHHTGKPTSRELHKHY